MTRRGRRGGELTSSVLSVSHLDVELQERGGGRCISTEREGGRDEEEKTTSRELTAKFSDLTGGRFAKVGALRIPEDPVTGEWAWVVGREL